MYSIYDRTLNVFPQVVRVGCPENTVPLTSPANSIFLVYLFSIMNGETVSVNDLLTSSYISRGKSNLSDMIGNKVLKTPFITETSTAFIISSC